MLVLCARYRVMYMAANGVLMPASTFCKYKRGHALYIRCMQHGELMDLPGGSELTTCCIQPMADSVLSALQQSCMRASYFLLPSSYGLAPHLSSFTQHPTLVAKYSRHTCSVLAVLHWVPTSMAVQRPVTTMLQVH